MKVNFRLREVSYETGRSGSFHRNYQLRFIQVTPPYHDDEPKPHPLQQVKWIGERGLQTPGELTINGLSEEEALSIDPLSTYTITLTKS